MAGLIALRMGTTQPELDDAYCEPFERPTGLVWVCSADESFSDVWMIENFDPEMAGRSR